jgi:hypothetical protein
MLPSSDNTPFLDLKVHEEKRLESKYSLTGIIPERGLAVPMSETLYVEMSAERQANRRESRVVIYSGASGPMLSQDTGYCCVHGIPQHMATDPLGSFQTLFTRHSRSK